MGQGSSGLQEIYFLQKVRLGHGSFGTVWRAVDRRTGAAVAMKHMDKALARRSGMRQEDVEREIAMMKACAHENIIQLFDAFEDANNVYLAQEYCDGGDFGDKLRERGTSVREPEAAEWMRHICLAIGALHGKQICHRDIKPDNFMVASGGAETGVLKLSDFGMAVFLPKGELLTQKCGTPCFMAPEMHLMPKWSRGYSYPADLWAAGVSMYQIIYGGAHPFLDEQGRLKDQELLRGVLDFRLPRFSGEVQRLCRSMVEVDPANRISAVGAIKSNWLGGARSRASTRQISPQHLQEERTLSPQPWQATSPQHSRQLRQPPHMQAPSPHPASPCPQSAHPSPSPSAGASAAPFQPDPRRPGVSARSTAWGSPAGSRNVSPQRMGSRGSIGPGSTVLAGGAQGRSSGTLAMSAVCVDASTVASTPTQPRQGRVKFAPSNTAGSLQGSLLGGGRREGPRRSSTDGDLGWAVNSQGSLAVNSFLASAQQLIDNGAEYTAAATTAWTLLICSTNSRRKGASSRRSSLPPPPKSQISFVASASAMDTVIGQAPKDRPVPVPPPLPSASPSWALDAAAGRP